MSDSMFKIEIKDYVAHLVFDNAAKANSLNEAAWEKMHEIFDELKEDPKVRVIVLSGEGKHFCAGIDLETLMNQQMSTESCEARKREKLRKFIEKLQSSITSIEDCGKPVIAAIHGGCIGGAVDIVSACDMRYCTEDAYFTIKETDLGLVADIGTMQRLPNIVQPGFMAEMAYTGRKVFGSEAKEESLVSRCYSNKQEMMEEVVKLAIMIASKSPLVTRGIKRTLLYQRDHTTADSLRQIADYNAGMLVSNDLMESFQAYMQKRPAKYED